MPYVTCVQALASTELIMRRPEGWRHLTGAARLPACVSSLSLALNASRTLCCFHLQVQGQGVVL